MPPTTFAKAPRAAVNEKAIGSGSGGVRAVDTLPPGAHRRISQPPSGVLPTVRNRITVDVGVSAVSESDSGSVSGSEGSGSASSSSAKKAAASPKKAAASPKKAAAKPKQQSHSVNEPVDDTLWDLANMKKVRSATNSRADSMDSADSSGRHANRKKVGDAFKPRPAIAPARKTPVYSQLPPPPPPPSKRPPVPPRLKEKVASESSDSDDNSGGGDNLSDSGSGSSITSSSSSSSLGMGGGSKNMYYDPLEEETLKAVRKAKLLARIEQMETKGVKRSKIFTFKTSEEELMVEVARMEVLAERAIRVEQGRAFLMTNVKAIERGSMYVDKRKWLPIEFNMKGYSNHLIKDIDKFDDCLERGVAETIGPSSSRVWWVELLWILVPSMAYYSMTNHMHKDPDYTNDVLRKNPEFQDRLAKEMARELAHTEIKDRATLEQELQAARTQLEQRDQRDSWQSPVARLNPQPAPPNQAPPPSGMNSSPSAFPSGGSGGGNPLIGNMLPPKTGRMNPPSVIPNDNPMGDYKPDPIETRKMMALLQNQQQGGLGRGGAPAANVQETIRTEVRAGMQDLQQNIREDQKRLAIQQRKLEEETAKREAAAKQRQDTRAAVQAEGTTRPRIPQHTPSQQLPARPSATLPPPPSRRTMSMEDDAAED